MVGAGIAAGRARRFRPAGDFQRLETGGACPGGNLAKRVFAGVYTAIVYKLFMSILGLWKDVPTLSTGPKSQFPNATLNAENKAKQAAGDADYLLHWIQNPPAIKPGVVMPAFGTAAGGSLSDDQIKAIIEYLLSLK